MDTPPTSSFGTLLRRHRQTARLSQEELAKRANLSREAVSTLERGTRRAPHQETVDLLAEALSLREPERAAFEAVARQQRAANRHLSTPSTPTAAHSAPAETPSPPEESLALSSGPLTPFEIVQSAPPSPARIRRKLIAALVLLLLLGGSALAVTHAFSGGGAVCLATDLPITANFPISDFNREVKTIANAINLAFSQNQRLGSGYTLKLVSYDDTSPQTGMDTPATGAHNVQQMAQNPCIVGMIGPYRDTITPAEIPIAANAGLVMISPTNTTPGFTLRSYAPLDGLNFDQIHPPGKKITYFRIAHSDVAQGQVDAAFAFSELGARSAYVINDRISYGIELEGGFTQEFQVKGGKIVGTEGMPSNNLSAITDIAARVATAAPDVVFYGGLAESGAGLLKAALIKHGYTGFFVGGDGIVNDGNLVNIPGDRVDNSTFATISAAAPEFSSSASAARFIRDYTAHYPGQDRAAYAAEAYDAVMVLITAIKHLIAAGQPVTRAAILDQVQHIQYTGVIGPISFDPNGDITHGVYSVYEVEHHLWTYLQELST